MNYLWDTSKPGPELPQEDDKMSVDTEKEGMVQSCREEETSWLATQIFFLHLKLECRRCVPVSAAGDASHKICLDSSGHMCWPRVSGSVFVGQQKQLGTEGSVETRKTGDHAFFQHVKI